MPSDDDDDMPDLNSDDSEFNSDDHSGAEETRQEDPRLFQPSHDRASALHGSGEHIKRMLDERAKLLDDATTEYNELSEQSEAGGNDSAALTEQIGQLRTLRDKCRRVLLGRVRGTSANGEHAAREGSIQENAENLIAKIDSKESEVMHKVTETLRIEEQKAEAERLERRQRREREEAERKVEAANKRKAKAEAKKREKVQRDLEELERRSEAEKVGNTIEKMIQERHRLMKREALDKVESQVMVRFHGKCKVYEWDKVEKDVPNTTCPICLNEFEGVERVWVFPCKHAGCEECFGDFLKPALQEASSSSAPISRDMSCPLCREPLEPQQAAQRPGRLRPPPPSSPPLPLLPPYPQLLRSSLP